MPGEWPFFRAAASNIYVCVATASCAVLGAVLVDRTTHRQHIVAELAQELDIPAEQVDCAYQRELGRLEVEARIHEFVPLLAARKVRSVLKHKPSRPVEHRVSDGQLARHQQESRSRAPAAAPFGQFWRLGYANRTR